MISPSIFASIEETSSLSSTTFRQSWSHWLAQWAVGSKCRSTHAISNNLREVGGSHRANNLAHVDVDDRDRANDFEIAIPVRLRRSTSVRFQPDSIRSHEITKNTKRLAKHIGPDKPQSHRDTECERVTRRRWRQRIATNGGNTSGPLLNACVPTIRRDARVDRQGPVDVSRVGIRSVRFGSRCPSDSVVEHSVSWCLCGVTINARAEWSRSIGGAAHQHGWRRALRRRSSS